MRLVHLAILFELSYLPIRPQSLSRGCIRFFRVIIGDRNCKGRFPCRINISKKNIDYSGEN